MVPATWDLFSNASIDRSLPAEGRAEVMQFLVERGNAEWDNDDRTRARLIFKSVEALASEIYLYAQKQALQGMIVTVYELHSADEHAGSGFFGTDPVLFLRALDALEQEGKVYRVPGRVYGGERCQVFVGVGVGKVSVRRSVGVGWLVMYMVPGLAKRSNIFVLYIS